MDKVIPMIIRLFIFSLHSSGLLNYNLLFKKVLVREESLLSAFLLTDVVFKSRHSNDF